MESISKEDLEWDRARGRLNAKIQLAFAGVRLGGGIGLFEADAWDMCTDPAKPAEARTRDERESWHDLSEKDLAWCNTALCFTDAEGYRYLLPAFMLAELNSDIDVWTLIHLCHVQDAIHEKHALLNEQQLQTVIEFLELYLDDRGNELQHKDITDSLTEYWSPLLEKTKKQNKSSLPTGSSSTTSTPTALP